MDKPKARGASRTGDLGGPPKGSSSQMPVVNDALHTAAARSDGSKEKQLGNFQILTRERTGVIPPASKDAGSQDVSLKSSINPNPKAESKGSKTGLLASSKIGLGSFPEKRSNFLAQKREFFNSLRKKTTVNHSSSAAAAAAAQPSCCDAMDKLLSTEQNSEHCADFPMFAQEENHRDGYCSDASVINQEETSGDAGVNCGDGADTSFAEKPFDERLQSQTLQDGEENTQSSCYSDAYCHPTADLDERDKVFLRSLGWTEDATEEALTAEEIAAFVKQVHTYSFC